VVSYTRNSVDYVTATRTALSHGTTYTLDKLGRTTAITDA